MAVISARVLVYRQTVPRPEFLLGHPKGPLWARKDFGAWMVPKGLIGAGEDPATAAVREFEEEAGLTCPALFQPLAAIGQAGGRTVLCWAAEAHLDLSAFKPGHFELEWPPHSRKRASFPESDRLGYFDDAEALRQVSSSQAPLITEVLTILRAAA